MRSLFLLVISIFFFNVAQAQEGEDQYPTQIISVAETDLDAVPEILPLVEDRPIRNVIFIIGDGTGLAQISSGQLNLVGADGRLHLQTLPVTGFVKTHASGNLITDSAAGATAYSCGIKTYNGAIGMDPDQRVCKTVLEIMQDAGYATGLVATSSITHATPASYASHVPSRSMENEIAAQLIASGVDVMLGGGQEYFLPASDSLSVREDDRDLISELKESGYRVVMDRLQLETIPSDETKLAGLFAADGLEYTDNEPRIADMTKKALDILSQDEGGFFLMVEGSQIDWGGHANNAEYVLREVRDFDQAVKAALDFAVEDGETLVVITADHETGGMTLQRNLNGGKNMEIFWTSGSHTGIPVPLMAYGPHALEFMGWRDNTYVGRKVAELLGITDFPQISSN